MQVTWIGYWLARGAKGPLISWPVSFPAKQILETRHFSNNLWPCREPKRWFFGDWFHWIRGWSDGECRHGDAWRRTSDRTIDRTDYLQWYQWLSGARRARFQESGVDWKSDIEVWFSAWQWTATLRCALEFVTGDRRDGGLVCYCFQVAYNKEFCSFCYHIWKSTWEISWYICHQHNICARTHVHTHSHTHTRTYSVSHTHSH